MFSKFSLLAAFTAVAGTTADPLRRAECSTAPVQCCNAVEHPGSFSPVTQGLFGVVNLAVHDITAAVGVTCNPITAIGVGSSGCSATPVCCENNSFQGVVALGCVPVNLSL